MYCLKCDKEVEGKIVNKDEAYYVLGKEEIVINTKVRVCEYCGEELFDEELDNNSLCRVYSIYRNRHGLIQPEKVKEIREEYKLTIEMLSKAIGVPVESIARYEMGSLESEDNEGRMTKAISNWIAERG